MGIGVQLGRPGKQVIVVSGDEVSVLAAWIWKRRSITSRSSTTVEQQFLGTEFRIDASPQGADKTLQHGPRHCYDKVFEPMGVYTEHVRSPRKSSCARTRAQIGKDGARQCIGDKRIGHPTLGGNLLGSTKAV
jgi:hypothetical protein